MNKFVLTVLIMSVLVEPVLSSSYTSKNVIDVGSDRIPHKPFLRAPFTDPTMNTWIP